MQLTEPEPRVCKNCLWYKPSVGRCKNDDSEHYNEIRAGTDEACPGWRDWEVYEWEVRQP